MKLVQAFTFRLRPDGQQKRQMRCQLKYKQLWRGNQVLAVLPAYTSQRCACCGHIAKENRLLQSQFVYWACGYTANADVNGARHILAAERCAYLWKISSFIARGFVRVGVRR